MKEILNGGRGLCVDGECKTCLTMRNWQDDLKKARVKHDNPNH
jgi:hypothetical protein